SAKKVDMAKVVQLIERLGNNNFEEREKASRELEGIGAPALEALRKATQNTDIEVKNRALDLVAKIEKQILQDKLLAPTGLRLVYKDTPVAEAVADLAKKSKYNIVLHDPQKKLTDRKVTLDTGETTFWEAFDQFCQQAGLMEHEPRFRVQPNPLPQ